jgi:Zn-dependent protease
MLRAWKLGTAFGIDLYVHWTFLLLLLFVMFSGAGHGVLGFLVGLTAVAVVILAFGCVVLHEYGHALAARRFGIHTRDITLYPIGGVARLERMSDKPWEEFWIAVAGPAVNVVIAALLFGLIITAGLLQGRLPTSLDDIGKLLLGGGLPGFLMRWNIWMVAFNMLPAFPMDGGRVLRALLATRLGLLRATEIATRVAMVVALLFVLAGFGWFGEWFQSPLLLLIAFFVFLMGQQELAMLRYRARHPEAGGVISQRPVEWYYQLNRSVQPPEPHFSGFTWDPRASVWIEWRDGRPIQACFTD